jgi:hypothetical protein
MPPSGYEPVDVRPRFYVVVYRRLEQAYDLVVLGAQAQFPGGIHQQNQALEKS